MTQPLGETDKTTDRPDRRRSRTIRWARRGAVCTLLSLLLLEGTLRLLLGLGDPVLYQEDPACGYRLVPSQRVRRFSCWNRINAHSMRSPEIQAPKPPREFRVLFVGDSVTYGTTDLDQESIFTSLLARGLPAQLNRPVEVLNASAGGWAVDNEVGYVRAYGTFESDLVVLVMNTGDLLQPFSRVELGQGSGFPDHKPALALAEAWTRYLRPRLAAALPGGAAHPTAGDPGSRAVDPGATANAPADGDRQSRQVLDSLASLKQILARSGAKFAIVYSPGHADGWDGAPYPKALLDLRGWTADEKVPLLDLTGAFAGHPAQEIYKDGIHLTAAGHQIAASEVERHWDELTR